MISADNEWRQKIFDMENMKKDLNTINKEIGTRKKINRDDTCDDLVEKTSILKVQIPNVAAATVEAEGLRDKLLRKIGNLVHPSVISSNDEERNEVSKLSMLDSG